MIQYAGMFLTGVMTILFIMMFVIEYMCKDIKRNVFVFKSPLYYSNIGNRGIDTILIDITVTIYFVVLMIVVLVWINWNVPQYYVSILENICDIEAIILGYFGVVISVIIFSVTLGPKEYYLTRMRDEVNRQFGIHIVFQALSICAVCSLVLLFLVQGGNSAELRFHVLFALYEICVLGIILFGAYGLVIIGMLTLGKSRMELYSLNKLYTKFWNNYVLKLVNQTEDVIYVNLGYLIKQYVKLQYVKKKQLFEIKEVEYINEVEQNERWKRYATKIMTISLTLTVGISITILLIMKNYKEMFITVGLWGLCFLFLYNKRLKGISNKYLVRLLLDNSGFLLKNKEDQRKDIFIGSVSLIHNRAGQKYVHSVCNMMALYCIICSCWKKKDYKKITSSLEDMIEYIRIYDESSEGYEKALLYLPVFLCGYYFYINFSRDKFPKAIVHLYDSFKLSKNEKNRYYITINSFIAFAGRYRPSLKDRKNVQTSSWNETYYDRYIEENGYSQLFRGLER